jgi:hypothetical protein
VNWNLFWSKSHEQVQAGYNDVIFLARLKYEYVPSGIVTTVDAEVALFKKVMVLKPVVTTYQEKYISKSINVILKISYCGSLSNIFGGNMIE